MHIQLHGNEGTVTGLSGFAPVFPNNAANDTPDDLEAKKL
jgi:hypothetical protein